MRRLLLTMLLCLVTSCSIDRHHETSGAKDCHSIELQKSLVDNIVGSEDREFTLDAKLITQVADHFSSCGLIDVRQIDSHVLFLKTAHHFNQLDKLDTVTISNFDYSSFLQGVSELVARNYIPKRLILFVGFAEEIVESNGIIVLPGNQDSQIRLQTWEVAQELFCLIEIMDDYVGSNVDIAWSPTYDRNPKIKRMKKCLNEVNPSIWTK